MRSLARARLIGRSGEDVCTGCGTETDAGARQIGQQHCIRYIQPHPADRVMQPLAAVATRIDDEGLDPFAESLHADRPARRHGQLRFACHKCDRASHRDHAGFGQSRQSRCEIDGRTEHVGLPRHDDAEIDACACELGSSNASVVRRPTARPANAGPSTMSTKPTLGSKVRARSARCDAWRVSDAPVASEASSGGDRGSLSGRFASTTTTLCRTMPTS